MAGVTGVARPSATKDLTSHTTINNPFDAKREISRAYTREGRP